MICNTLENIALHTLRNTSFKPTPETQTPKAQSSFSALGVFIPLHFGCANSDDIRE
jgi:hypothetical protein